MAINAIEKCFIFNSLAQILAILSVEMIEVTTSLETSGEY